MFKYLNVGLLPVTDNYTVGLGAILRLGAILSWAILEWEEKGQRSKTFRASVTRNVEGQASSKALKSISSHRTSSHISGMGLHRGLTKKLLHGSYTNRFRAMC